MPYAMVLKYEITKARFIAKKLLCVAVADPDMSFGGHEAPKAPRLSAEGARIEAPKAPRGMGRIFSIFY